VAELAADEQVALCAHELAHVARRDPAWVLLARLAEALAPVQPLNAWARRRLQDLAECLSDDLAVTASGRPLGLARSLVDVASWTLGERPLLPAAAPARSAPAAVSDIAWRDSWIPSVPSSVPAVSCCPPPRSPCWRRPS